MQIAEKNVGAAQFIICLSLVMERPSIFGVTASSKLGEEEPRLLLFFSLAMEMDVWLYRVSHGKRMFLRKAKLCEYFNKNFIMYIKTFTKLCHYGIFRSKKL